MFRLLTDENFNHRILRGLLAKLPSLDVVRVEDVGLRQTPDPAILEWCAVNGRIMLTHDQETMIGYAYDRVSAALPMPGVIFVDDRCPIGQAIADLETILQASKPDEYINQVVFLPM